MPTLLIVDDEDSYREVLKVIFEAEGYSVSTATNGNKALAHLKNEPCDLIISDVRMPDMDGIGLLRSARELHPDVGVVMMTAFGTIDNAREAFKLGADDFISKPFHNDELKLIVRRTLEKQTLVSENRAFRKAQKASGSLQNIVGSSEKMQELFRMIETVARDQATVLITGESGTGKELFARAIHDLSPRSDKPFIPVNCGAMPENLLESELFGYMKGAFTGADRTTVGMFESADKGSIFLDEIGDMPLSMQVKMLRVLQERRIRRVGAPAEIPVDTRVVAATNRDLRPMVENGTFRRDLFYRISVIPLHVPALRDRREDIPELTDHFVKKFSSRSGKKIGITPEARRVLHVRSWPGNVRELEHTIERAVALTACGGEIRAEFCTDDGAVQQQRPIELPDTGLHLPSYLDALEKEFIAEALRRTDGNHLHAAELLHLNTYQFGHLLEKHELQIRAAAHGRASEFVG